MTQEWFWLACVVFSPSIIFVSNIWHVPASCVLLESDLWKREPAMVCECTSFTFVLCTTSGSRILVGPIVAGAPRVLVGVATISVAGVAVTLTVSPSVVDRLARSFARHRVRRENLTIFHLSASYFYETRSILALKSSAIFHYAKCRLLLPQSVTN